MKKNRLLKFLILNLVIFNILFFFNEIMLRTVFRFLDVYSKCPPETLICDPGSYTIVDDIIMGLFVVSIFAAAVSAAILLNRQIEKLWQKRQPQPPRPRRRP